MTEQALDPMVAFERTRLTELMELHRLIAFLGEMPDINGGVRINQRAILNQLDKLRISVISEAEYNAFRAMVQAILHTRQQAWGTEPPPRFD